MGRVHLHQAFYRYPNYEPDGSPYGGRGLKVVRHHYFRGNWGVYTFGCRSCSGVKTKGDLISNWEYRIRSYGRAEARANDEEEDPHGPRAARGRDPRVGRAGQERRPDRREARYQRCQHPELPLSQLHSVATCSWRGWARTGADVVEEGKSHAWIGERLGKTAAHEAHERSAHTWGNPHRKSPNQRGSAEPLHTATSIWIQLESYKMIRETLENLDKAPS